MNEVWSPQPRQRDFMQRWEDEALYGGAAGGGKSSALVNEALRQVNIPHYRALILRKTFPQLTELIDKSHDYYPAAFPKADYNKTSHAWTFPSGAQIIFGSMQHTKDRTNYQGKAYQFIAFDELTQFTYDEYIYLLSRNRPNGPGVRCYVRATANPGGIGHGWVKDRFVTAADPGSTIWEKVIVPRPDGSSETRWRSRVFIPSTVYDNKILLANDPDYLLNLAALPEAERKALLLGDWDSYSGQFFTEWRNDPEHYEDRRFTHVISPFDVPSDWTIVRSYDHGRRRPFSVGWWAVDYEGTAYRIAEYYGWNGTPNEGKLIDAEQIFSEVARIEREHRWLRGKKITGVADPAIFSHDGTGPSVAEIAATHGIHFVPGNNDRLNGWEQMHYRFAFDRDGYARMYIFSTCKQFIRTVPELVYSESHVEDLDSDGEDHPRGGRSTLFLHESPDPAAQSGGAGRIYRQGSAQPIPGYTKERSGASAPQTAYYHNKTGRERWTVTSTTPTEPTPWTASTPWAIPSARSRSAPRRRSCSVTSRVKPTWKRKSSRIRSGTAHGIGR